MQHKKNYILGSDIMKYTAFIDSAVADSIRELEKKGDDLSKAGVTMLGNVDGKSMVEQMSPQLYQGSDPMKYR